MAKTDSLLTVRLEALGRDLTNIQEWSIDSSFTVSTDGFDFTAYDDDVTKLRNLELQPVELLVNGHSQVLGRIDMSSCGDDGTAVRFAGRDYLADIVECNVDPLCKIKESDSIAAALTNICSPCDIDTVISDDDIAMRNVRTGIFVKKGKGGKGFAKRLLNEYKPKPGEGMFETCNRLIARFGATIQPGPDRNTLIVTAPRYDQEPIYTVTRSRDRIGSGRNNAQSSVATRDFSSFPTFALGNGWQAPADGKGVSNNQAYDINELVAVYSEELKAILADSTLSGRRKPLESPKSGLGQLYRLLYVKDTECRNPDQLESAMLRAIAERMKSTLEYRVTLEGHVEQESGAIWSIDTMVKVRDDVCGVNENLWIKDRKLVFSPSGGATTDLVCVRPGSFVFGREE